MDTNLLKSALSPFSFCVCYRIWFDLICFWPLSVHGDKWCTVSLWAGVLATDPSLAQSRHTSLVTWHIKLLSVSVLNFGGAILANREAWKPIRLIGISVSLFSTGREILLQKNDSYQLTNLHVVDGPENINDHLSWGLSRFASGRAHNTLRQLVKSPVTRLLSTWRQSNEAKLKR